MLYQSFFPFTVPMKQLAFFVLFVTRLLVFVVPFICRREKVASSKSHVFIGSLPQKSIQLASVHHFLTSSGPLTANWMCPPRESLRIDFRKSAPISRPHQCPPSFWFACDRSNQTWPLTVFLLGFGSFFPSVGTAGYLCTLSAILSRRHEQERTTGY